MPAKPDRKRRKRNKWRRRFRQPVEIAAIWTWMRIGPRLARKMTVRLSHALANIAYGCSRRTRDIGFANLDCIYGDTLSPAEKKTFLKKSLQTNCLTLLDIFWFSRHAKKRIDRYVHWNEPPNVFKLDRPIICITAHYGNWEILAQKVVTMGHPLMSVAHPLINEYADHVFIRIRQALGQDIVSSDGALRKLMTHLKTNGNVALVMDQNTKPHRGGIFVDFFGIPVPISSAPASLAIKTNAILAFGFCSADDKGHYHIRVHKILEDLPLTGDHQADITALTQLIAQYTEEHIRQKPEPWMWTYKRWSHIQPDADPDTYPSYALPMLSKEL